jgi:N-acetylmuramoyl-L-alanine amidase
VGLVKSFYGGLAAPGRTRVVIEVTGPVIVEKAGIETDRDGRSPQLVLEIVPAEAAVASKAALAKRAAMHAGASGLGAGGLQPPIPKPAVSPQARAAGTYRPVIVLDPGHGGEDSGAKKFGTVEKDVVLSFALKLREKLQETGRYKVLMTRETDVFVPLEERREFAEQNTASLFIAIHADYARSQARGATIYSLRDSVASALQRSAKGEVVEDVLSDKELAAMRKVEDNIGAVRAILADLARLEVERNKERTNVFARSVIDYMRLSTNLKDNPDRSAAFMVLKTAKVPSVLIELAYVSNQEDAQLLRSDAWRDKVSGSIVTAIENYFSHQVARLPL